jgi:hypothetical protein
MGVIINTVATLSQNTDIKPANALNKIIAETFDLENFNIFKANNEGIFDIIKASAIVIVLKNRRIISQFTNPTIFFILIAFRRISKIIASQITTLL